MFFSLNLFSRTHARAHTRTLSLSHARMHTHTRTHACMHAPQEHFRKPRPFLTSTVFVVLLKPWQRSGTTNQPCRRSFPKTSKLPDDVAKIHQGWLEMTYRILLLIFSPSGGKFLMSGRGSLTSRRFGSYPI